MNKQVLRSLVSVVVLGVVTLVAERAVAEVQMVSVVPFNQEADENTAVSFDVMYSTDTLDDTLSGLGLRIHFDSSKVTFDGLTNILSTSLLPFNDQVDDDTGNEDGDARTDKKVVIAWADIFNKAWPGEALPVRLLTANFTTVVGFNTATDVNFTSSSTAAGYTFNADSARIQPTNENTPPVADAGPDQTVDLGATVTLDGSGSSDAGGDPLSFAWAITTRPAGSTATLSSPSAEMPTFVADVRGSYTVELVVNDGIEDSAADQVTVATENVPPVADAGPDQVVDVGDTADLDGSDSSDADLDPLTYNWSLTAVPPGSGASPTDPSAELTSFGVDGRGTYVARLVVNDGKIDSDPDEVTVTAVDFEVVIPSGGEATLIDDGARAVVFEGVLEWRNQLESAIWSGLTVSAIGAGDESTLLSEIGLYRDGNGNNSYDANDPQCGDLVPIPSDDADIVIDFPTTPLTLSTSGLDSVRFFLVVTVAQDPSQAGLPAWLLVVWLFLAASLLTGSLFNRRWRKICALVLLAGLPMLGQACSSGGGGSSAAPAAPPPSTQVQFGIQSSSAFQLSVPAASSSFPVNGPTLTL